MSMLKGIKNLLGRKGRKKRKARKAELEEKLALEEKQNEDGYSEGDPAEKGDKLSPATPDEAVANKENDAAQEAKFAGQRANAMTDVYKLGMLHPSAKDPFFFLQEEMSAQAEWMEKKEGATPEAAFKSALEYGRQLSLNYLEGMAEAMRLSGHPAHTMLKSLVEAAHKDKSFLIDDAQANVFAVLSEIDSIAGQLSKSFAKIYQAASANPNVAPAKLWRREETKEVAQQQAPTVQTQLSEPASRAQTSVLTSPGATQTTSAAVIAPTIAPQVTYVMPPPLSPYAYPTHLMSFDVGAPQTWGTLNSSQSQPLATQMMSYAPIPTSAVYNIMDSIKLATPALVNSSAQQTVQRPPQTHEAGRVKGSAYSPARPLKEQTAISRGVPNPVSPTSPNTQAK